MACTATKPWLNTADQNDPGRAAGHRRDHHLRSIYRKLGITSRAELVLLADQLTGS